MKEMEKFKKSLTEKGTRHSCNARERKFDFSELARRWPSTVVARSEVAKFTGGLVRPKTLANAESLGIGPRSYRFGKKIFYHANDLITWMSKRQGGDR